MAEVHLQRRQRGELRGSGHVRKASYSAQNGNCVEVGGAGPAVVVRDTKDAAGAVLAFGPDAWGGWLPRSGTRARRKAPAGGCLP
jgi:hypothetical protein